MKQARIVEHPPKSNTSHGFWYTLETFDGQALHHAFAREAGRTGGKREVDSDKRAQAIGHLRTWAHLNDWEIVEEQPDSPRGPS